MKRSTKTFLIAVGMLSATCTAGLLLLGCVISVQERKVDDAVQEMAREFSVGHTSRDFIIKARSIGAFDYSVAPADSPVIKTPIGDVPQPDQNWNVDRVQFEDDKTYSEKLDVLEDKFVNLKAGSASIMLMVIPPFGREGCHIDFKDGKVTAVRVFYLD